ncbi:MULTISPECIES: methyltransferase domain-containing protein [Streptosporangium]|uniref:methyltransferase domain-containing protein n=1 Tax=Streptosporangium TaxID=2000 RepID=UPI003522523A
MGPTGTVLIRRRGAPRDQDPDARGDLRRLPVADGSCDAVVCSLVLCCAARVRETLREVRRVPAPRGELRFYEHQRSGNPMVTPAESLMTPL